MGDENITADSRIPLIAALVVGAIMTIAAVIGWYRYTAEIDANQTLAGESGDLRQQVRDLEGKIQALTGRHRSTAESLAQSDRESYELETAAQQLTQDKTALEAELAQERQFRRQIEDAFNSERGTLVGLQQNMTRLKTNYEQLEQELAQHKAARSSLSDQVSAVSGEKLQLLDQLARAKGKRQNLLQQISMVTGEIETREAELSTSRQNMKLLNAELAQTRQEQHLLKIRVVQLSEQQQKEARDFGALKRRLERELNESRVEISQLKNRMTVISLTSEVLFNSGSANIKPAGREVLSLIASALNAYPDRAISVDGHTDDVPIGKGSFYKSNWELSVARALAAVKFLQAGKLVSAERLKVVGHGEFSPVASNDTAEGRQLNRRIEIRVLPPGGTNLSDS